jgi:hypothetical protein
MRHSARKKGLLGVIVSAIVIALGMVGLLRDVTAVAYWAVELTIPLLIDFAAPTSLLREAHRPSSIPIIGNGPPGTFVLFPNGFRVSLPTDQIVFADDTSGHARVGLGGMQFEGLKEGRLVFVRVRDLFPEDQLSPARSHTMRLDPRWVATISVDGRPVWPAASQQS